MTYKTKGVCSSAIDFDIQDGIIHNVRFTGGCNGNAQGVAALVEGMNVDDAINRLSGISCNGRASSCPDQLAKALSENK